MADWSTLPRNKDGRWMDDGIPNMVTKKTEKTDDEKATDQREIAGTDSADSSTAGSGTDGTKDVSDTHGDVSETGDPKASDSDKLPAYTGIDGEAFPDKPEPKNSDQTETVTNDAGTEYEQPKFRAIYYPASDSWGVSLFNWVGPEAITIPARDLADFKAFVGGL